MKKAFLFLTAVVIMLLADALCVSALEEESALLFLNGALVTDYEVLTVNNTPLVPLRLIAEQTGASVDWDGKERAVTVTASGKVFTFKADNGGAVIYNNLTYVPLSFIEEHLDAKVLHTAPITPPYTYYHDTQMPISAAETIVRHYENIIIDAKHDFGESATAEEAAEITRDVCLEGLGNFAASMRARLSEAGEDMSRLDADFEGIEREINRMLYIGEVSKFFKFTIGPYDILFDRFTERIFFVIHASGVNIKEADVNDESLFIHVFIVG